MKISYAITVCNEFIEIQRLISFLLECKRAQDEIVVQMDLSLDDLKNQSEDKSQVHAYLMKHNSQGNIRVVFYPLNGHFANFKNHLTEQCTGDYIFQIDADEIPHQTLIELLPQVIENNDFDICLVPRVNTVKGLTEAHIQQWGWSISKLESQIGEKEFDLSDSKDRGEYELLKKYNLVIEENVKD